MDTTNSHSSQNERMIVFIIAFVALALAHSTEALSSSDANAGRRAFLSASGAAIGSSVVTPFIASAAPLAKKPETVIQQEINTFNSLIYNFQNTALDGGLDASKLDEPSIPFIEFGAKMKAGEVTFVEFMAPSGAVAYATLKGSKSPIRIGQGYPTGAKGSWSSPDFVIRSVSNYNVPYKFTVPALANYSGRKRKV